MVRRVVISLVALAVLGAVSVAGVEATRAARLQQAEYQRNPIHFTPPEPVDGVESFTLRTKSGVGIAASFVAPKNGVAVVVAHGSRGNRAQMWPDVVALVKGGFGVLAFDWPGQGESEGDVRLGETEHQAFTAAVDFLAARPDVQHIGAYGFSDGAGLSTLFAADDARVTSLVGAGTWSDLLEQIRYKYRHRWGVIRQWPAMHVARAAVGGNVRPIDVAEKLRGRPTLFVSGSEDPTVPPWMSAELARATEGEVRLINGSGHASFRDGASPPWGEQLVTFFTQAYTPAKP
jgi:pimeloyl-ACP methyl ester carboxylesterase